VFRHAVEVLIDGVQRVGLEFAERLAELLLNPIYGMEENSAFGLELSAAEPPVGAQKKVIFEDSELRRRQGSLADEIEIRREFLISPAARHRPAGLLWIAVESHPADAVLLLDALPELVVTGAEDPA
jgi:hypothetical protein